MKVSVRNDNVEAALAIFNKKCKEVILEVKERQEYVKPSIQKRRALQRAKIREQKRKKGH